MGHLLLGHVELSGETLKGTCLFHGVEVGALEILNDGDFHRLLIGDLAKDCGDSCLPGSPGRTPAAFSCDELKAAIGEWAHQDGLDYAVRSDGSGQLRQLLLIDMGAGLKWIAIDLVNVDLERPTAFGSWNGSLDPRKKRVEAFAESATLWINGSNVHGSKSFIPGKYLGCSNLRLLQSCRALPEVK
jgi:hypothetical protein